MEAVTAALKRFANELPIIAVGVWALLRVIGVDVDETVAANIVTAVESVVVVAIGLLVRNNIDGPLTVWHANKLPE